MAIWSKSEWESESMRRQKSWRNCYKTVGIQNAKPKKKKRKKLPFFQFQFSNYRCWCRYDHCRHRCHTVAVAISHFSDQFRCAKAKIAMAAAAAVPAHMATAVTRHTKRNAWLRSNEYDDIDDDEDDCFSDKRIALSNQMIYLPNISILLFSFIYKWIARISLARSERTKRTNRRSKSFIVWRLNTLAFREREREFDDETLFFPLFFRQLPLRARITSAVGAGDGVDGEKEMRFTHFNSNKRVFSRFRLHMLPRSESIHPFGINCEIFCSNNKRYAMGLRKVCVWEFAKQPNHTKTNRNEKQKKIINFLHTKYDQNNVVDDTCNCTISYYSLTRWRLQEFVVVRVSYPDCLSTHVRVGRRRRRTRIFMCSFREKCFFEFRKSNANALDQMPSEMLRKYFWIFRSTRLSSCTFCGVISLSS